MTDDLKLLKSAQGLKAVAGASVIQVALAILSSIAIDQFVAIETARPKLEASLALAKQPVDLDVLAESDNGEDMLYLYWSRAMDTGDTRRFSSAPTGSAGTGQGANRADTPRPPRPPYYGAAGSSP